MLALKVRVFEPETLLRWHPQLVARRWTYPHRKAGRPALGRSLRELILRLARENLDWGYRCIVGELKGVGVSVSGPRSARSCLKQVFDRRRSGHSSWRTFLRQQAATMLACDFLTVETAFLQQIYVLFFISLAPRRIEYVACSAKPDGSWVTQPARNLFMQLGDEQPFRFLVHDRDAKFCHAFDGVFRSEGITVIRTPIQAPNANPHPVNGMDRLRRRDLLGELIHEYEAALICEPYGYRRPPPRRAARSAGPIERRALRSPATANRKECK